MNSTEDRAFCVGLRGLADRYGMALDDAGLNVCMQHFQVLTRWNRVMNLVGDLTVDSAVVRHYGESLYLAGRMSSRWRSVADFGSGAGFPGIGVAAHRPDIEVALLEVRQKRVAFLREATRGMVNVSICGGAAEMYAGSLDAVVTRAVNIQQVVDFASRRGIPAVMLVGASDSDRWGTQLLRQGWKVSWDAVPWRPESMVLSVTPSATAG